MHTCEACQQGKAHRLPSSQHAPEVFGPGALVSMDFWDACTPHRHGGQRQVLVIIDHYSGYVRGFLVNQRSDAYLALDMYLNYARSHGVVVRRLHKDGAGEFGENSPGMREVLAKHGLTGMFCGKFCCRQGLKHLLWKEGT